MLNEVAEALRKREFEAVAVSTKEEALALVMKEVDGKDVEKKLHDAAKEPEKQNEPQLNISNVEKKGPGVDVGNL